MKIRALALALVLAVLLPPGARGRASPGSSSCSPENSNASTSSSANPSSDAKRVSSRSRVPKTYGTSEVWKARYSGCSGQGMAREK